MLKAGLCRRLADAAVITLGQKDGICEAASWGWGEVGRQRCCVASWEERTHLFTSACRRMSASSSATHLLWEQCELKCSNSILKRLVSFFFFKSPLSSSQRFVLACLHRRVIFMSKIHSCIVTETHECSY